MCFNLTLHLMCLYGLLWSAKHKQTLDVLSEMHLKHDWTCFHVNLSLMSAMCIFWRFFAFVLLTFFCCCWF